MSHHIVELRDVHFSYPDGTAAINGVSFRITHGESVGIVGANGSGKSTVLLHINGSLMPSRGSVVVGDLELGRRTKQDIRKKVGVVFQNPDDQLFMPTVFEDVAFGPLNLGLAPEKVKERVAESLDTVGCSGLEKRPPHHLSGGQKSAVAIATVLAMRPDILVMDEPASSLDPRSRRQLINLLRAFSHTRIIASHDLDLILDVCERCIVIKGGRVMADGKTEEVLSDSALLEDNGLELPLSLQKIHRTNKGGTMDDIQKLKHLIEHWSEHNADHARTYREWAKKAEALGNRELGETLNKIAERTSELESLFTKASSLCR